MKNVAMNASHCVLTFILRTAVASILQQKSQNLNMQASSPSSADRDALQSLNTSMKSALNELLLDHKQSDLQNGLSQDFVRGLLMEPMNDIFDQDMDKSDEILLHRKLMGLPRRPFYAELTRRLCIIRQHQICNSDSTQNGPKEDSILFLPARHLGMTEFSPMHSMIPLPTSDVSSIEECKMWLRQAGEKGILALLGMRTTIGTATICFCNQSSHEQYLLPPSYKDLLEASRESHRPNSQSKLTVSARALAKHADRGKSKFFGIIKGSEATKNKHAETIVLKLIREAEWINIHNFGGTEVNRPVIEVRTDEGYGARWSAVWKNDAFTPEEVSFRGFLEPQMEDGHEQRWRH